MPTMREKIARRIARLAPGATFTPKDFLDIASRGSIDVALAGLLAENRVRRVRRGLYDRPKISAVIGGELSPDLDRAARAMARRFRWRILPDGAWAANLLGISTQVPAKAVYLSDGPFKKVAVGKRTLHFKHARPQAFAAGRGKPALAIQALRFLGKTGTDRKTVLHLRRLLTQAEKRKLVDATRFAADWIHEAALKIAGTNR